MIGANEMNPQTIKPVTVEESQSLQQGLEATAAAIEGQPKA